jgi:uncharacterized protein (TIGR02246 family)
VRVEHWAERYARAWEDADDEAAGALFTDDATYRSDPFREPHRGRDAIRAYWREVTASQSNVSVSMGRPIAEGRRGSSSGGRRWTMAGPRSRSRAR